MNCRDIEEFGPLYLSGELEEGQRALFRAHLAQCRSCASAMDRHIAMDGQIRRADLAELPDAGVVERSVRGRISRERAWRVAAVAAAVVFASALGYWALRPAPVAKLYADAALDHR